MTLEEYATGVNEMVRRVVVGIAIESAATVKVAQQSTHPETIAGLVAQSERLGYVRGLFFAQALISQEAESLRAQGEYDARTPQ